MKIEVSVSNDRKLVASIRGDLIEIHSYSYIDWDHIADEFKWQEAITPLTTVDIDDWSALVELVNKMDKLLVLK
jgi:hypothetical protein